MKSSLSNSRLTNLRFPVFDETSFDKPAFAKTSFDEQTWSLYNTKQAGDHLKK
jgi:hypothetical protein